MRLRTAMITLITVLTASFAFANTLGLSDNGDGTWTLLASDLVGITVTPPADVSDEFALEVAVTTEGGEVRADPFCHLALGNAE